MPESDLDRLHAVADDAESAVLDELAIRAGILWRCAPCGAFNTVHDDDACEECRAPRHAASVNAPPTGSTLVTSALAKPDGLDQLVDVYGSRSPAPRHVEVTTDGRRWQVSDDPERPATFVAVIVDGGDHPGPDGRPLPARFLRGDLDADGILAALHGDAATGRVHLESKD